MQTISEQDLENYKQKIANSYGNWIRTMSFSDIEDKVTHYKSNISFTYGKKYIKCITNNSVHSFIVIETDNKFMCGDILKAASWNSPAKNFARGSIFNSSNVWW